MYPTIFLGSLQISAYTFFAMTALAAVIVGSYFFAIKRGFKKNDILIMLSSMSLAAFIGARLFNILVNYQLYQQDPSLIFSFTASGFSLYGGILLAIVVGGFVGASRKIPLLKLADTMTPFIGIGIALMRIGCFLNGCCFGKETNFPLGVKFPLFSPAHIHQISENIAGSLTVHAVHPTELYELTAALIGALAAFYLLGKNKSSGTVALVAVIYFSIFRWFNMQLRILPYSEAVIQFWYPLFYFTIILISSLLLYRTLRPKNSPAFAN